MVSIIQKAVQVARGFLPRGHRQMAIMAVGGPSAATRSLRLYVWAAVAAAGLLALVLVVFGVAYLLASLPACDEDVTRSALAEVVRDKKIRPGPLSDIRTVSSTRAQRMCQARMEVTGATVEVAYRIDWSGRNAQMTITDMTAQARIDDAHLDDVKKATSAFLSLAKDSAISGRPPRQSEPAARALLERVFDLARIEGATLAVSDIPKASEWFAAGDRVGTVYMLAGTGMRDIGQLPATPAGQQQTHRNVVDFAPEFARYVDFQVTLAGIMADAALKRMDEGRLDDATQREIDDVRATLIETLLGDLSTLTYDGLSDEWRHQRLAVMQPTVRRTIRLLDADQAQRLRQHALTVTTLVRDKSVQEVITALADAIAPP